ncbi:MAG: methylenetetrahydrofolate--tRNA-(uracil(54)-C(5))-methyltransferase (FADH(2)-oxidizing) TrmFO, partial [Mesorhizobium sp.]
DWDQAIIATGPLTAPSLAQSIADATGADALAFFDAIAPIVHFDTIDMNTAWFQSRYDKVGPGGNGKDYINCPMDKDQYFAFVQALLEGQKTEFKEWEGTPYFDGCLPIEVMAERGVETLRYGPMKPMGLTNAHNPSVKAYAVVQLRQDNALGTLYNMVGFQTKLKHAEQVRIFRTIPGLENAEFAGRIAAAERLGQAPALPPLTTAFGALLNHITGGHIVSDDEPGKRSFQPMNVNFGLFPPVEVPKADGKRLRGKDKTVAKRHAITARALADCRDWLGQAPRTEAAA